MNKWVWALVAVAGGIAWHVLLPPQPVTLSTSSTDAAPIRGAIHVHTRRSDGTGTVDDVAAAARRAGLQFVIFTDHGDGTRGSDTPVYRYGVLCIDAVEISTNGGHVVALGLPQSEFPLAGELADVLEDVRRMGGMSIAAHPDSPRAELRWNDWNAAFDGIEWLNGDSQWRDEGWGTLGRALFTYPFRRAATLATLLDRPDDLLNRWDTMIRDKGPSSPSPRRTRTRVSDPVVIPTAARCQCICHRTEQVLPRVVDLIATRAVTRERGRRCGRRARRDPQRPRLLDD